MDKFYNTPACVSDAAGYNVDLDTEYMYTPEGNELSISYFKYDREQGWIAVAKVKNGACKTCKYRRDNCVYKDRVCSGYDIEQEYIVSGLYMQHPAVVNIGNLISDIHKLKDRIKFDTEVKEGMYSYLRYDLHSDEPHLNKLNSATYLYMILNDFLDKLEKLGEATKEN